MNIKKIYSRLMAIAELTACFEDDDNYEDINSLARTAIDEIESDSNKAYVKKPKFRYEDSCKNVLTIPFYRVNVGEWFLHDDRWYMRTEDIGEDSFGDTVANAVSVNGKCIYVEKDTEVGVINGTIIEPR